jgi:hypothetical protein
MSIVGTPQRAPQVPEAIHRPPANLVATLKLGGSSTADECAVAKEFGGNPSQTQVPPYATLPSFGLQKANGLSSLSLETVLPLTLLPRLLDSGSFTMLYLNGFS